MQFAQISKIPENTEKHVEEVVRYFICPQILALYSEFQYPFMVNNEIGLNVYF